MPERNDRRSNRPRSPFFARFLEGSSFPRVKTDLKGGGGTSKLRDVPDETHKYPSDSDEGEI